MKSFIYPILLALAAFAYLGGASPAEPEDPIPEDFQKFVQTEVTLSEDEEPDMDEDEEDRNDIAMSGSENRYLSLLAKGIVLGKVGYATAAVSAPRLEGNLSASTTNQGAIQIVLNDVARSLTGCKRKDHVRLLDLLGRAGILRLNAISVKATAVEAGLVALIMAGIKERLSRYFGSITIEPAIFLYMLGGVIVGGAALNSNLLIQKVCLQEFNYNATICDHLELEENEYFENNVQTRVNNFQMNAQWIGSVPTLVYSLFA
eukprot:maker-scaffold345_size201316-snap-gene-0.10 protein:Tk12165 transcript:maker-scaffold345_size201316-snap-gene-0.10-mRNA-1 annotation:"YTP1"